MKSSSRGDVDPFIVMDVMENARAAEAAGQHVVHMEVGQPGTPAPKAARLAAARSMETDPLGYTVALGLPALRARIAQLYGTRHDIDLDPRRVIVTSGSSAGFLLAFTALFDARDRLGIGLPGYPSYRQIAKALSLEPVDILTFAENRFQPAPEDIQQRQLDGLILASPANPTGTMIDRPAFEAIIDITQRENIALISDEIYHGIEYEATSVSALELTNDAYVINSFSKYFSMTGWRIGWMVVPEDHVRGIERLAQNMFICAPHISQVAALAALDADAELQANLAVYQHNRTLMQKGLPSAGLPRIAPADGAFYVYADVSDLTDDSHALAAEILTKCGVAVTPGIDFDPRRGRTTLRFSHARRTREIEEGLSRLSGFFASYTRTT